MTDIVSMPNPTPELVERVRGALPRLAELREGAKMSQAVVAARCGVTRFAVSRWEAGDRVPSGFSASALYVVLDELGAFDPEDET